MIFGPVALDAAEGCVLANSQEVPGDLVRGGRLKKGIVLRAGDVAALRAAGLETVLAARLESGDLSEDAAAERLARALVPDPARAGLRLGQAATGRVNVYAEAPGVVEVVADRVHALNAVDPMITVATVPEWQRVGPRSMVATVKIIAYAVPGAALEAACHAGQSALRLRPVVVKSAQLIQTSVSGGEDGEKGQRVTAERLARLGVTPGPVCVVRHAVDALAEAIARVEADVVLILTGSATSDPLDVAPQAVRAAGGVVDSFGMPVDPGNLLFFGRLGDKPVIGLPGCARSPALNGADWVLERLLCGVPLSAADVARMGVGGLLKEIPVRGRLREG
ncbi:molybdopterin-binding protein [Sagittula salina]|uniref:Molybdopterin-binding protein n=1 Tax=Sagittula salina TaxID=2820268 RepID=A0A940MNS8_9RHOB|nr:molybdopterin-binding protein [Sagittula salina]MBP0482998.1 molybdopterin-binding protein [Sagittula salina]